MKRKTVKQQARFHGEAIDSKENFKQFTGTSVDGLKESIDKYVGSPCDYQDGDDNVILAFNPTLMGTLGRNTGVPCGWVASINVPDIQAELDASKAEAAA